MSSGPMEGVKVVEVAQFTYVPSAGATLADWGATVFKIEHAFTGWNAKLDESGRVVPDVAR